MDGLDSLRAENDALRADLAQMKSTLSDTQQTLRAVQEDRDEFAAKMNDAVERAERLESELSDTKRQYEWSRLERDRMEKYGQFERGLINALQFALLCVTGNTERVNGIDWLWNEDSLNFKDKV